MTHELLKLSATIELTDEKYRVKVEAAYRYKDVPPAWKQYHQEYTTDKNELTNLIRNLPEMVKIALDKLEPLEQK